MIKKITLAVILILGLTLTACELPYQPSQPVLVTPSPTSREFTDPMDAENPMAIVESIATGTAAALTAAAGGATSTSTPIGGTAITPDTQITFTPTPIIAGGNTLTPSLTSISVGGATVTPSTPSPTSPVPTTIVNRPATYTLQNGEHPYCIARRFNVDPDDLLALSGITRDQAYSLPSGTLLRIPQSGSFPGERALIPHSAGTTYTVTGNGDTTVYAVACLYGDVDPARIVQANPGLSLGSILTIGQRINIP